MPTSRVHTLVFDDPDHTLEAVRRLRGAGFCVQDVRSPFPIHGMDEALGLSETRLGFATLAGGLTGLAIAFVLQIYTHVFDWPLVIGGKSFLALPALVPVGFELTVLLAAFGTVAGLFIRARLRPPVREDGPYTEAGARPPKGATDDHFVVIVAEDDARFSPTRFSTLCRELSPLWIADTRGTP